MGCSSLPPLPNTCSVAALSLCCGPGRMKAAAGSEEEEVGGRWQRRATRVAGHSAAPKPGFKGKGRGKQPQRHPRGVSGSTFAPRATAGRGWESWRGSCGEPALGSNAPLPVGTPFLPTHPPPAEPSWSSQSSGAAGRCRVGPRGSLRGQEAASCPLPTPCPPTLPAAPNSFQDVESLPLVKSGSQTPPPLLLLGLLHPRAFITLFFFF